jgi:hypothetical protein
MTPVAALAKLDLVWKSHWGNRRGCVSVMGQKEKGTPPGWSFFTTLGGEYLGTHWPSLPACSKANLLALQIHRSVS